MNEKKKGLFMRVWAIALALATMLGVAQRSSYDTNPLVVYDSDTTIVIRCEAADGEMALLDYMNKLKGDGEIEFEISNGMISSINGIANPADYSSCWMLYTSDTENANSAWGTVLYDGKEYGSAILGAEALKIKEGCLYIWVFKEASW